MSFFSRTFKHVYSNVNLTNSNVRISDITFKTILPENKPSTVPIGTYRSLTDTHLIDLHSKNPDLFKDSSSKNLSVSIGEDYNTFLENDLFTNLDLSSLLKPTSRSSPTFLNDYKFQHHTLLDLIGADEDDEDETPTEVATIEDFSSGNDQNNIFRPDPSSSHKQKTYDGREGIDTFVTNDPSSYYKFLFVKNTHFALEHYSDKDSINFEEHEALFNIERIEFTDKKLAFDLYGNAGVVAKVYGAVLGKDSISDPELIGSGLEQIDNGLSPENFAAIAIKSAGLFKHKDIVHALWNNVVGSEPTAAQANYYIDQLDRGEMDIGELGLYAANHSLNENNINLIGLQTNGIEFA